MPKEYLLSADEALDCHRSTREGLSSEDAAKILESTGSNELIEDQGKSLPQRIIDQIKDPMIIVLIAAAIISGAFGEIADMTIILVVVVLNAILGIYQEGKAEEAIAALRKNAAPHTRVRRDNTIIIVPSSEIVPGDIVIIEAGDTIAADLRLIESTSLKIEEATLTGESMPTEKNASARLEGDEISLGDRCNMAYMGTNVVHGRGEGLVVSTAMNTEMGHIAGMLKNDDAEKTPLQKKLADLSKTLSIAVLGICILIFFFMVFRAGGFEGGQIFDAFLTSVSLAVAAIPEGLVVVVTVLLSVGVTKMSKRNAIIRRLTAVETLGCTQVICSDKTGTLTQNKMTVVDSYGNETLLPIAMALCNDASIGADESLIGDPTETALLDYAFKAGAREILDTFPRVAEAPFDSERKLMSTINIIPPSEDSTPVHYRQFTKGALDELLQCCTHLLEDGEVRPLLPADIDRIRATNKSMADKALRVLAAAYIDYDYLPQDTSPQMIEKNLIFIGLTGMIDPIRPEAKKAIEQCRAAGIRVIMITGDHKDTAMAIAKELGILDEETIAITGAELDRLNDDEFQRKIEKIGVYARVQPEHKVRIVDAWQSKGKITAMTGDGVNDAPALKSADIGIGMGITGTDVTKNVSDMILTDDNFATIVSAVDEGRRIYENIRKAVQFLLASNLSEVFAIFIATLAGWRLFAPIHILWINLITDTFPALALGMEEGSRTMNRKPRNPDESIFADRLGIDIAWQGIVIGLLTLISFIIGSAQSQIIGMTMAFLTLSMCEIFHSMNMRSRTDSILHLKKQNKYLWGAMLISFVSTLAVIYLPGLNEVFQLSALPVFDFLAALGIAFAIIPLVEIVKAIRNR